MADPDPSVSNGTCFFMPAVYFLSDRSFIPCGNAAFGNIHCCQAGDHCLEEGACYNEEYGTTYLAGCTDFNYKDASCPDKKAYWYYPWTGLIYCKFNRWVACEEEGAPGSIREGDECTCPPDESITVAFSAPSIIPGIGVLPTKRGGTIEWSSGHLPATNQPKSPTTSETTIEPESSETTIVDPDSSSLITSPPGLTLPIPTNPSTESNQDNNTGSALSTGAIAGIATGASIGAILLLGTLSALWLVFRRRRRTNDKNKGQNNTTTLPGTETGAVPGPGMLPQAGGDKLPPAEVPLPEVLPRPAFSELHGSGNSGGGVGPRAARPELLGDVSPPVSPPLSPPGSGVSATGGWGWQCGGEMGGHGQQGYFQGGDGGHQSYYMPQGSPGQQPYYMAQGNHGQQPYHMPQGDQGQPSYHTAQGTHGQQAYHTAQGEEQGRWVPPAEGSRTNQEGQEGASELPG